MELIVSFPSGMWLTAHLYFNCLQPIRAHRFGHRAVTSFVLCFFIVLITHSVCLIIWRVSLMSAWQQNRSTWKSTLGVLLCVGVRSFCSVTSGHHTPFVWKEIMHCMSAWLWAWGSFTRENIYRCSNNKHTTFYFIMVGRKIFQYRENIWQFFFTVVVPAV